MTSAFGDDTHHDKNLQSRHVHSLVTNFHGTIRYEMMLLKLNLELSDVHFSSLEKKDTVS